MWINKKRLFLLSINKKDGGTNKMKIEQYLEKKKEIIESNRLENRGSIKNILSRLASKISDDKDLLENFNNDYTTKYIFMISDQFLLCRYIDEINGYKFGAHKIVESNNKREWKFEIKSEKSLINSEVLKVLLESYIKDPYFCINYDKETDEYLSSKLYKDLININAI